MTPPRKRVLFGIVGVVVLMALVYIGLVVTSGSSAHAGTTVEGVDIGGMSEAEAAATVQDALGPAAAKRLKVRALDQTFGLRPVAAGLSLDAAASVAPAFGDTWNPITLLGNLIGTNDLPAVVAVDGPLLTAQVQIMADAVDVPPTEPTLVVEAGEPVLTPGVPGRELDRDATASAMVEAVLKPRAPVEAVVLEAPPIVTDAAVQDAIDMAASAAASPVTVTADTITAVIPAEAVGRALSFTQEGTALVPQLDGAVLHKSIADELGPIEVTGRDATFKIRNGNVKVVKSKVGRGVSDDELATAVSGVLVLPAAERAVTVIVGTREPELTTDEAKALGITQQLSSFTQYFPYAAYRVQNIGEAARRVNGTVLLPGETFSLNDTIKERTEKNGYTVGFVVGEGGVFAEALGGGVSTAATTVWTAAFYAGMERVETVAHSIYISRYKPGLEATVAWGMFDMRFRNDTPHAVLITSGITNGSITVSFWGTKEFSDIQAEFGERRDIVPFATIYDKSDTCLGQGGVDGFAITVDRVFYKDGAEVAREPITTRYKPAPEVICGKNPDKKPGKKGAAGDNGPSASPSAQPDPTSSDAPTGDGDTFSNG